jgi:hypothetical protein
MNTEILIDFQDGGLKWVRGSIDVILYTKIRDWMTLSKAAVKIKYVVNVLKEVQ